MSHNGWPVKSLGELCDVLDHKRVPITKKDRVAGDYPYYGATGVLDYVEGHLFDEPLVLVGEDGAKWGPGENSAFHISGKTWVNNHAHVLRPRRTHLDDNWLIHYLNHSDLMEFVSGLTVPKLNQGSLREIPIPLPPLPEQRRIVGILDEAFAAIATAKANAEKNLQNARDVFEVSVDAYFAQLMKEVDGRPLSDVVESISTGPFGSLLHKSDYEDGGVPLVNPINIQGDAIVPDPRKAVGAETARRLARYVLRRGDVVTARRGEIGRCAAVGADEDGWICGTGSFFIRPGVKTDPQFLTHLLRSFPYRSQLERLSDRATMPSIGNDDLAGLVVHIPPLERQKELEAAFGRLRAASERLGEIAKAKLLGLDALKASLLQEAFAGEL